MRARACRTTAALILALAWTAGGCAQKRPLHSFPDLQERIKPGDTLFIVDDEGAETRGRLAGISSDGLTLLVNDARRHFPEPSVASVDRYGDPLWNGLAIGLGTGVLMAALADPSRQVPCRHDASLTCWEAPLGERLAIVAVFGGIGLGLDALVRKRTRVYEPPAADSTRRRPTLALTAGRRSVVVAIRY